MALSITGFRSYPTPVTVDFSGKTLTAVLGDTGAGKSSILEAITYALFRTTTSDGLNINHLIADNHEAASVEFTFSHGGNRWRVNRTMNRGTTPSRHHLTNLDTGEEVDDARPVDNRVKSILGMGAGTFLRVGLLPQGQFDRLLTTNRTNRTPLLRELFGTESLDEAQKIATAQHQRLDSLIARAELKRSDTMPPDPAQAARDAAALAEAAEARVARLETAVVTISGLREKISTALHIADQADADSRRLHEHPGIDAVAVLDEVQPVADGLTAEHSRLAGELAELDTTDRRLTERISKCEAAGDGIDALSKAAALIDGLATRIADHRAAQTDADDLRAQLATENDEIATAEAELVHRAEQAEPLIAAAESAELHADHVRIRAEGLRNAVTAAATAAGLVSATTRAHSEAVDSLTEAERTARTLTENQAAITDALAAADAALATLTLRDQAAAIATDLHPGDDCPVCRRTLPDSFVADAATNAAELREAKATQHEAQSRHRNFCAQQAAAQATVTGANDTVIKSERELQAAQRAVTEVTDATRRAMVEFATLAPTFNAERSAEDLVTAVTALSGPETAIGPAELTGAVCVSIDDCVRIAEDHARELHHAAADHSATIDYARSTLLDRKATHERAERRAAAESDRLTARRDKIAADIATLPTYVREHLPNDIIATEPEEIAMAAATVSDRMTEVQQLAHARESARKQRTVILAEQRSLDDVVRNEVDAPLNELLHRLLTWANVADQTVSQHKLNHHQMPPRPTNSDIGALREFLAALAQLTTAVVQDLTAVSNEHQQFAEADTTKLMAVADTLGDVDGFDRAAVLTDANALHPVVEAKANASKSAQDHRTAEKAAMDLVKPAADLDFAIAAGKARLDAVKVLKQELVPAKFLGHLTDFNTRALLGIASDLLGTMTGDRFGFAEDFEIVTRGPDGTGFKHPAARLSGGEKFLASLALALALAELHSRSGPRLGSLFLDEGFATLDTDTLESALTMLRAHTGKDRMVMVISHLHAIAEAVDDVLWVEKGEPAGSMARWLTPAERDELVNSDVAGGLQALT
ncbi:AAA family ATPase [Nocardia cerradoensis]|uniref:AAA family ATPase n=1 Tax=Nocardia cerradoensis TaxID=85688 RepID=UPI001CB97415|nr:SMC family ATPase [Nocardia cerradoensis]